MTTFFIKNEFSLFHLSHPTQYQNIYHPWKLEHGHNNHSSSAPRALHVATAKDMAIRKDVIEAKWIRCLENPTKTSWPNLEHPGKGLAR
jgi:hypothetical protein